MRDSEAQKTPLRKIFLYLGNYLVIAMAIGFAVAARAQSYGKSPAALPKSALASAETCPSYHSVFEIESRIPQLVNSGRWHELELVGDHLVRACPDYEVGYHWLGVSYLRQGRCHLRLYAPLKTAYAGAKMPEPISS